MAEGQGGLEVCDATDLPSSQQLAAQRGVVFEEWQVVEVVEHQDVAGIEFRRPPQHAYVICVRDNVALVRAVVHALGQRIGHAELEPARVAAGSRKIPRNVKRGSKNIRLSGGGGPQKRTGGGGCFWFCFS